MAAVRSGHGRCADLASRLLSGAMDLRGSAKPPVLQGYVRAESTSAAERKGTFVALTVRPPSVVGRLPRPDPGVIRALAAAIVGWSNGSFADERLELIAHRLGGPGSFRSDSAPNVEAVATFLRAGVCGDDAPPDE
jgi:hypothetical protein